MGDCVEIDKAGSIFNRRINPPEEFQFVDLFVVMDVLQNTIKVLVRYQQFLFIIDSQAL